VQPLHLLRRGRVACHCADGRRALSAFNAFCPIHWQAASRSSSRRRACWVCWRTVRPCQAAQYITQWSRVLRPGSPNHSKPLCALMCSSTNLVTSKTLRPLLILGIRAGAIRHPAGEIYPPTTLIAKFGLLWERTLIMGKMGSFWHLINFSWNISRFFQTSVFDLEIGKII
jgi:hypothetical protein